MVDYLLGALTLERGGNAVFEIGGEDCVTYGDVMREYARQRNPSRRVVAMPLLTEPTAGASSASNPAASSSSPPR